MAEKRGSGASRALVRGRAGAGKTTAALARVVALVGEGTAPGDVTLVCATPTACADARRALEARDARLAGVGVTTAMDLELGVLAAPAARAVTGRRARVLTAWEESFLLEDLRATGLPARRLRGMLGFFRKSLTELADDDMASFIIDPREQAVLDALRAHLAAYDAMLDCEVGNLCVNYLRRCPDPRAEAGVTHVVADDYQCLNLASQLALELMAPATLDVFADPTHAAQGADPFPNLVGVASFLERNPGAEVTDLPDPPASACRGAAAWLAASGFLGALSPEVHESRGKVEDVAPYEVRPAAVPPAGVRRETLAGPEEELAFVAGEVRSLLEAGVRPTDVLVLAPNRSWERGVRRALAAEGVASQCLSARQPVGGDLRDLATCGSGRMFAALGLLADPDDPLAWRCWCGCGDHLARSVAFAGVEGLARERGVSLGGALGLLAAGDAPAVNGQDGVLEAWRQGRSMLGELAGLRGDELLASLARGLGLPGVPEALSGLGAPDAAAADLASAARRRCVAPELGEDERGVRVADYGRSCGMRARHVFVCGLMGGWLPVHAWFDPAEADFAVRQKMDREARATLYELAGRADESLTLSGFSDCDLELAEHLRLKGGKVRMGADGRRVTSACPSPLGEYALRAWGMDGLP